MTSHRRQPSRGAADDRAPRVCRLHPPAGAPAAAPRRLPIWRLRIAPVLLPGLALLLAGLAAVCLWLGLVRVLAGTG